MFSQLTVVRLLHSQLALLVGTLVTSCTASACVVSTVVQDHRVVLLGWLLRLRLLAAHLLIVNAWPRRIYLRNVDLAVPCVLRRIVWLSSQVKIN